MKQNQNLSLSNLKRLISYTVNISTLILVLWLQYLANEVGQEAVRMTDIIDNI